MKLKQLNLYAQCYMYIWIYIDIEIKTTQLICSLESTFQQKVDTFSFSTSSFIIISPDTAQSLDRACKPRDYVYLIVQISFDTYKKW